MPNCPICEPGIEVVLSDIYEGNCQRCGHVKISSNAYKALCELDLKDPKNHFYLSNFFKKCEIRNEGIPFIITAAERSAFPKQTNLIDINDAINFQPKKMDHLAAQALLNLWFIYQEEGDHALLEDTHQSKIFGTNKRRDVLDILELFEDQNYLTLSKWSGATSFRFTPYGRIQIDKLIEQLENEMNNNSGKDPRKVFLVFGQNDAINNYMKAFLKSIDLIPMDLEDVKVSSNSGSNFNLDLCQKAFDESAGIIVLFTPDEYVHLRPKEVDGKPTQHRLQSRPNVYFEAGCALMLNRSRTFLLNFGNTYIPTDLSGLNYHRFEDSLKSKSQLFSHLKSCEFPVKEMGNDYLSIDFPNNALPKDDFKEAVVSTTDDNKWEIDIDYILRESTETKLLLGHFLAKRTHTITIPNQLSPLLKEYCEITKQSSHTDICKLKKQIFDILDYNSNMLTPFYGATAFEKLIDDYDTSPRIIVSKRI